LPVHLSVCRGLDPASAVERAAEAGEPSRFFDEVGTRAFILRARANSRFRALNFAQWREVIMRCNGDLK
jgi:hypothetical protein